MLKSIKIENFESHEDTTIHFTDGLNLIVGLSNSGKCVCGNSYVRFSDGLRKIRTVFPKCELQDDVFYNTNKEVLVSGNQEKLEALYFSGYKDSIIITLINGTVLECSLEEPVLVWDGVDFCEKYKKANELTIDDYVIQDLTPVSIRKSVQLQKIDWSFDKTAHVVSLLQHETMTKKEIMNVAGVVRASVERSMHKENKLSDIRFPQYLNSDLAYLCGILDGDGCLSHGNYVTADEFLMKEYSRITEENFGVKTEFKKRGSVFYTKGNKTFPLIVRGIMNSYGQTADVKCVPDIILNASWEEQLEYVRGIMDTDGSIESCGYLELVMNSKDVVLFVKNFVESIGYCGTLSRKGKAWRYTFTHFHFSQPGFVSLFRLPRKKEREKLQSHFKTKKNDNEMLIGSAKWFVDNHVSLSREQRKRLACGSANIFRKHDITVTAYNKLLEQMEQIGVCVPRQIPKYHTVVKISAISNGQCDLFDVTNPISHSFVANGIIVHNTSILRALACVVDNRWDKSMVRTGYEFCRVKIETDKGWVECERGEKVNRWSCQENGGEIQNYRNVGTDVPELATRILGMGERDRGSDLKELPNFQFQLEKHYMLSEIDGKKATSNMIARMMDNAIGLGGMEDLIKAISTDMMKDRKWLAEKQREINELNDEIVDEKIFNKTENLINDIADLQNDVLSNETIIDKADAIYRRYIDCKGQLNNAKRELKAFDGYDNASAILEGIQKINEKASLFEKCKVIADRISELQLLANIDCDKMSSGMFDAEKSSEIIEVCQKANRLSTRINELNGVSAISADDVESSSMEVKLSIDEIRNAKSMLDEARELWRKCRNAEKDENAIGSELEKSIISFEELKDKLGVCPLCGNKL